MKDIARILVPIDGSTSADKAVGQAIVMAHLCQSEIDFVFVANVKGFVGGYPLSDSDLYPNAGLDDVITGGKMILESAVERVPEPLRAHIHCVQGEPEEQILQLADSLGADMIIMGSRGRGALKSAFLGSVSQYVVEHAKCPVMVVKADKK